MGRGKRKVSLGTLYLALFAFLYLTPSGFTQVNVTRNSVGSDVLGGRYVGSLYASAAIETNVAIICDDFTNAAHSNQAWSAQSTVESSNAATSLSNRLGQNTAQQSQAYAEAAYLSQQLLSGSTCPPGTKACGSANYAGDIQYAIWKVFDPSGTGNPFTNFSGNDYSNATNWLKYAQANAPDISTDSKGIVYSSVDSAAQGFHRVRMFESNAFFTWVIDLAGLGGLLFYLRRRTVNARA